MKSISFPAEGLGGRRTLQAVTKKTLNRILRLVGVLDHVEFFFFRETVWNHNPMILRKSDVSEGLVEITIFEYRGLDFSTYLQGF